MIGKLMCGSSGGCVPRRAAIPILIAFPLLLVLHALPGSVSAGPGAAEDLLPERPDAPRWYKDIYSATRAAPTERGARLVDAPRRRYDVSAFISRVIRADLLPKNWQERLIRLKEWMPIPAAHGPDRPADAYHLRFDRAGVRVHVLDCRQYLYVALAADAFKSTSKDAALASLQAAYETVLLRKLPVGRVLGYDAGTGIWRGITLNRDPRENVRGADPTRFGLFWHVGHAIVVLRFQKFEVPGCDTSPTAPLFRHADEKPSKVEESLAHLEGIERPSADDIPALVKILRGLPTLDPPGQLRTRPHETRLLAEAKVLGCRKLVEAVRAIRGDERDVVRLVRHALRAVPREPDLRGQAKKVKRAAIRALWRIDTTEAQKVLNQLVQSEKDPRIVKEAMGALTDRIPKEERAPWSLEQLKVLADEPDSRPQIMVMLIRGLPVDEDLAAINLLRRILHKARDPGVRGECVVRLANWISDPMGVRNSAIRVLKQHLNDGDIRVRAAAIYALGRSGDVRCVRLLAPLAEDRNAQVRWSAAGAICALLGWNPPPIGATEKRKQWFESFKTRLQPVLKSLGALGSFESSEAPVTNR